MKECELCDNAEWRPGAICTMDATAVDFDSEAETAVKAITNQILVKSAE
jgi:hypothetical protein